MKRLALILALFPALALGQNVRFDLPITTTQAQGGNLLPVYAIPGALVSFYNEPAGTLANTYNSATSVSACPTGAQVVLNGSAACVSSADPFGNMGSWFQPGQYMATITAQGRSYNYFFTISGSGSGSGVTSVTPSAGVTCTPLVSGSCTGAVTISLTTPLVINSFSGCAGALELGATQSNPAFTASYSVTPSSANITNTDGINSPFALTTPFTSGTVTGSFTHSTVTTTTFTLTAIGSSTQTATCTDTWSPRIFSGLGTSGATGATASGTNAVLVGATGTLPTAQLGAESVGTTFGPFAPSGQNVYMILTGGSHTFVDVCSGFPFSVSAATPITFVNADGVSVSMFIYQSAMSLTGSCFEPKVQT
jgi:hypothetical protein